jgi:mannosyltransferase OCH1-like enzyme
MNEKYIIGILITLYTIIYIYYIYNKNKKLYKLPLVIHKNNNSNNRLSIYQSFQSRNVSFNIKSVINDNISLNPEYNYYLYDDYDCRKFIHDNFNSNVLYAFDKLIPGAYKSDLWRYCILYVNGGVYMDIKFKIIKPLHTYIKDDTIIFVKDLLNNDIYNAIMIAPPKNILFKYAIQEIVNNVKNNFYGNSPLDPTGPRLLGNLIKKHNYTKYITLYLSSYLSLYLVIKNIKTDEIYFQSYILYRYEQSLIQTKKYYAVSWNEKNIYYTDKELKNFNYNN